MSNNAHRVYRRKQKETPQRVIATQDRYPSAHYRRVAFVYAARSICPVIFIGLLIAGLVTKIDLFIMASLPPLIAFSLLTLIFWGNGNSVLCRLCKSPFLRHLTCTKRKGKIPSVCGDRSLATAISLLLKRKTITCQYCGERHKYFD